MASKSEVAGYPADFGENMRLIRFGDKNAETPGLLLGGIRKDISAVMRELGFVDFNHRFFTDNGLVKLHQTLQEYDQRRLPDVDDNVRWAAPVARPGKVVCIGLNYADHAREAGTPLPVEPILFLKASNAVVGPYDDVLIPRGSTQTDWEIELGVVVGRDARYLRTIEEAAEHIAGYCISHDVSERAFQHERGGQWTKGKSCDTFNPLGPWVATAREIQQVGNLSMSLTVNGAVRQQGNTATMIFNATYLVHYVSQFMTLEAGDVLTTGTPSGVGASRTPPQYLKSGDVVELSIDHLGVQRQRFINA